MHHGFHSAALSAAHKCMIQPRVPKLISQSAPANMKKRNAAKTRPCTNWPRPGTKRLQSEAITFPAEPCPALITSNKSPGRRVVYPANGRSRAKKSITSG